jgi:endoglucanase
MNAWEYTRKLHAGWNLGNTLDAINRDAADATPEMQETAWHNPITTPEMIKLVKDAGFDMLRIPVTWGRQMGDDHVVKKAWMDRVQEIVDYGINCGLTTIVNLHHEDWHFPSES